MNKSELIAKVAERAEVTKKSTGRLVDTTVEVIIGALATGDRVQLAGFGTFEPKKRAQRTGRNPQNGEELTIPERVTVSFRPGKHLKGAVVR